MHTHMYTYIHTYIHVYKHIYIHYIHIYIYIYIYIGGQVATRLRGSRARPACDPAVLLSTLRL